MMLGYTLKTSKQEEGSNLGCNIQASVESDVFSGKA